jgi:hypothetical protein
MMEEFGKVLVYVGVGLIITGLILIVFSKFGSSLPFGRLPGDIYIKKDNFVFFFPLGTSILISLILTLIFFSLTLLRK